MKSEEEEMRFHYGKLLEGITYYSKRGIETELINTDRFKKCMSVDVQEKGARFSVLPVSPQSFKSLVPLIHSLD